ncbi:MAG TPA: ribonuclease J [Desulfomonilaceae bacterium]|nr:ribonuclease J [Desulfomonilaceae bacterium]
MGTETLHGLHVLPLGGLGEIGLNMMLVAFGKDAFIIDTGLMFPDESMPGIDIVIPDLEPVLRGDWNILGIVLTHGHEDHIGALPYVLKKIPVPVFATGLTMGMVENKLEEFGLVGSTDRRIMSPDHIVELGPFRIDSFAMCHSVADGVGLAIQTPAGVVIHSGDFKLDPTPIDGRLCDLEKLAAYSRSHVLALFSDSTNVEKKGSTRSESMIRPAFEKIFKEAAGRILIATFSSNIHRIQQVLDLAQEYGRKVVLVGRSMASNARIATDRGYLEIPEGILVDMKELGSIPENRLTILSTGSQGEPMSALSLMAFDKHKYLKVKPADVVVLSSRFIPGNEKAINHIINEFARRGAHVMYEKISDVHVSGHASQEELRYLIRLVKPNCFIPVHGEYRHLLLHAQIAIEEGVPPERVLVAQDGDLIEMNSAGARIVDQLDAGRIFVHGKGVGDIGHDVLRDRRTLSEVGIVTVVLVISEIGRVLVGPELYSRGVTFDEVEPELLEGVRTEVEEKLSYLDPQTPQDWEASKDEIRLAVRRNINRVLGRKPLVQTIILQV